MKRVQAERERVSLGISRLGTLIGIGLKRAIVSLLSRLYRLIKRMGSSLLEALKRGGWKEGVHHASVYDSRSWQQG